ncbi:DUF2182 domain-containing protein [Paractinoplanes durhamensis]|uniref:copper chaperone n=1 Tax=Paractinoplanes durhamensis TaxID=113563 RepID=UPI0031D45DC2
MSATATEAVGRRAVARFRAYTWRHPEWPVLVVAAAAGVSLVAGHTGPHAEHAPAPGPGAVVTGWLLMSAAMMLPPALPAVRHAALTGKRRRRPRTVALFTAGYLLLWAAYGLVAIPAARLLGLSVPVALLIAAAWELTPWKRGRLRKCRRRPPLPPDGRRADLACLRAGLRHGLAGAGACWAVMLPMAAATHPHLLLTAVLTLVVLAEELLVSGARYTTAAALILITAAAVS